VRDHRAIVGVDLDGVLGDQVSGVLERENARLGLHLTCGQIQSWDLPFGDTTMVRAIRSAMLDPGYVLQIPVHSGARDMLEQLKARYVVKILTVRPVQALALTKTWLNNNGLVHDELVLAEQALKSRHGADALVDDYVENVAEFLNSSAGTAILIDRPWNQDVEGLDQWLGSGRVRRLSRLCDVAPYLLEVLG